MDISYINDGSAPKAFKSSVHSIVCAGNTFTRKNSVLYTLFCGTIAIKQTKFIGILVKNNILGNTVFRNFTVKGCYFCFRYASRNMRTYIVRFLRRAVIYITTNVQVAIVCFLVQDIINRDKF